MHLLDTCALLLLYLSCWGNEAGFKSNSCRLRRYDPTLRVPYLHQTREAAAAGAATRPAAATARAGESCSSCWSKLAAECALTTVAPSIIMCRNLRRAACTPQLLRVCLGRSPPPVSVLPSRPAVPARHAGREWQAHSPAYFLLNKEVSVFIF